MTEANPTDKTVSLPFFFRLAAGGEGGSRNKNERKRFWSGGRRSDSGAVGAPQSPHHALRAYDWVQSHHARGACEDQSLCDWKWVRAWSRISAPNDTSDFERGDEARAEGAGMGKNCRRVATKWLGEETEKWADLFLASYPKIIFINFQY